MALGILAVILLLNLVATAALWRVSARKPPQLKKSFIAALLHSKPFAPKHKAPKSIGSGFDSLVTDKDRHFFDDFEDFGGVLNDFLAAPHVASSWRLQELAETELRLDWSDTPDFGRSYEIYYNQVCLGRLEVSPGIGYSAEKPEVFTRLELDWVRLLAFDTVREFLCEIAEYVCDPVPNSPQRIEAEIRIDRALTRTLWQTLQVSEFGTDGEDHGSLELQLYGSALWYRRQQTLRKGHAAK